MRIHSLSHPWYLSSGRYQFFVSYITGFEPLIVLCGLMSSVGDRSRPHFSHWSPYAPSLWQYGHSPVMYRSARNWRASTS